MLKMQLKDEKETRISIAQTGKSLRQFSKEIGISQAYLSQVLSGQKYPPPTVAYKIASGLEADLKDIFLTKVIGNNNQREVLQ